MWNWYHLLSKNISIHHSWHDHIFAPQCQQIDTEPKMRCFAFVLDRKNSHNVGSDHRVVETGKNHRQQKRANRASTTSSSSLSRHVTESWSDIETMATERRTCSLLHCQIPRHRATEAYSSNVISKQVTTTQHILPPTAMISITTINSTQPATASKVRHNNNNTNLYSAMESEETEALT